MSSACVLRITLLSLCLGLVACAHESTRSTSSNSESTVPIAKSEYSENIFAWPVDSARLTRGFRLKIPGKKKRPHLGIDLAASKGTNIYSAQDGVVIYTGKDFHGYGRMVMIEGKAGFATLYAHLSKTIIKQGMRVKKGDLIALMGNTGRSRGTHLHFEIRKDKGPVDPLLYLPQAKVASNNE